MLEADANTGYFHGVAKRKCTIKCLEERERMISETHELKKHITDYYKGLFGSEPEGHNTSGRRLLGDAFRVSEADKETLVRPFSMEELEQAVKEMRNNTAPGPDGFSTLFFKEFWGQVKHVVLEMLNSLHRGELDLARLNYGIITLLPKVKGATNIKQFRPICLLNVIYKIITKVLTVRLTRIADGVVMLHEVLHQLKTKKREGIVLKLDFEKA